MDWNKAKNYTIVFLIILNLFLFICNYINNTKYDLNNEKVSAIEKVLEQNGIKLLTELPKNYNPMSQISLMKTDYDIIQLQDIFLSDKDNVKRTQEFGKTIITSGDETISIYNDLVSYENVKADFNFEQKDVIYFCDKFVKKIDEYYYGMEFDRFIDMGDYYVVNYSENYNEFRIFNNYIRFMIYSDGKVTAEFKYNTVDQVYGTKTNICSADEALFIFMDEIKTVFDGDKIDIEKVELGYFINDGEELGNFVAVPHYRIFISDSEKPYYINAYNSMFVAQ